MVDAGFLLDYLPISKKTITYYDFWGFEYRFEHFDFSIPMVFFTQLNLGGPY